MSRITESSLMEEDIEVRYCFIMFLAIADPKGYAIGTDVAIARRMNMPVEDFQRCVAELMKTDPDSNSKEEDGRRIIESDGERGYFVVNYAKYRDTRDEEDRRNYMRDYMRKYREQKDVSTVKSGKLGNPQLAKADADAEEKGEEENPAALPVTRVPMTEEDLERVFSESPLKTNSEQTEFLPAAKPQKQTQGPHTEEFESFWISYPKKVAKGDARKAFSKIMKGKNVSVETLVKAVERAKRSEAWKKEFGQYIPNPATWLNGERWLDDLSKLNGEDQRGKMGIGTGVF